MNTRVVGVDHIPRDGTWFDDGDGWSRACFGERVFADAHRDGQWCVFVNGDEVARGNEETRDQAMERAYMAACVLASKAGQ